MKKLILKFLLLLAIVGACIFAADRSGLFKSDLANDHEQASWNAFYEFTKNNEVDVLLIGNSHLYTGVNPNHLSCLLGANCFILAASGAPISDTYFSLREALKRCSPKLVVVETYGIGDDKVRELKAGNLSNEYKSFNSRRNIPLKLLATPVLFSSDNYLSAWSTSIRNHDFIFKDPGQIKKNFKGQNHLHKKDLELGRFTRFTSGITAESDSLYDVLGPVVDGDEYLVNRENYDAVKRIQSLCRKKGIPQVYFTVPMYSKHVTNYSRWHKIVSRVIGPDYKWLDLQDNYDSEVFTADCFEDTRKENQHTSALGALMCDYKLARFIQEESGVEFEDRHSSPKWRSMFYSETGYFERFSVDPDDRKDFLLCRNVNAGGILIKDCIVEPLTEGATAYMKIDKRTDFSLIENGLDLIVDMTFKDEVRHGRITMNRIPGVEIRDHYLLMANLSSIEGVTDISITSISLRNH